MAPLCQSSTCRARAASTRAAPHDCHICHACCNVILQVGIVGKGHLAGIRRLWDSDESEALLRQALEEPAVPIERRIAAGVAVAMVPVTAVALYRSRRVRYGVGAAGFATVAAGICFASALQRRLKFFHEQDRT